MKLLLIIVPIVLAVSGGVAWKFLPVVELHGRPVMLGEWFSSSTQFQLEIAEAQEELDKCLALPQEQQFIALFKLEREYGDVFIIGDRIRAKFVALGENNSVVHIANWLHQSPIEGQRAVISGVEEALRNKRGDEQWKSQMYRWLESAMDESSGWSASYVDDIPGMLFKLDPAKAEKFLKTSEYLTPDYRHFDSVVRALTKNDVIIPRGLLEAWLLGFQKDVLDYGEGTDAIVILTALSVHDRVAAESGLAKIAHSKSEAAVMAAEQLLHMRDLPHPRFHIWDKAEKDNGAGLTPHERTVWMVDQYNYAVENGGLATFEHDAVGNSLPEIIESLKKVGANSYARRLEQFSALFGPQGPPKDEVARDAFVSSQGDEWSVKREELDAQYFEDEQPDRLVLKYILDNADKFEKVKPGV